MVFAGWRRSETFAFDVEHERRLFAANQHGKIEIVEHFVTRLELEGDFDFSIRLQLASMLMTLPYLRRTCGVADGAEARSFTRSRSRNATG